ncbi:phosphoenolpyruvate carboxykinase (ATP) [Niameybacter massiliensis]|uniref:hypothetical protein n=1 Tax=Niameybacter massiliensis TaxID=1658108 RepID=UPI0006B3F9C6|nr:hypothetical protein [Niameybacter massiliensis]
MRYTYKVYGLTIESEIEIPEFLMDESEEKSTDKVYIRRRIMSANIKHAIHHGRKSYMSPQDIWFNIPNVATYRITKGNHISYEPCKGCDKQLLKIFLMCSCLGFIMIQRKKVAIHGGTVVMRDKAIVITGDRGAGKSTLTTALRQKGYKFLTDDVAATTLKDTLLVQCGFPYQKLCEDTMNKLGYDKMAYTSFEGDNKVKYIVPAFEDFQEVDTPLQAICEVVPSDVEQVGIEMIKGQEKLQYIMKNVYRAEFLPSLGLAPEYFKQCVEIAKHVQFYKIKRPRVGFTVEEQIRCIEEIMDAS